MQDRIAFMGTPEFSVPSLRALSLRVDDPSKLLVVTQPDRSAGRGRVVQPPPVKAAAERMGLDVLQVLTLKGPEARARLEAFAPSLIVVAAFGLILPSWVLSLPPRSCVNLHASLLPRFRGASPIAAAIASGDGRSGVSLMEMEAGLDTGGVYAVREVVIHDDDTTESLTTRLADLGADLLDTHLEALLAGELMPLPQRGQVIETRKIIKDHGAIDWSLPAQEIERHIRAMWSWPRAWTQGDGDLRLQVHAARVSPVTSDEAGTVLAHSRDGIVVGTGADALELLTVQLPGKAAQAALALRQHPIFAIGAHFEPAAQHLPPWIIQKGQTE